METSNKVQGSYWPTSVSRLNRRGFLQLSIVGLAGLTVADLIAACSSSTAASSGLSPVGLRFVVALTGPSASGGTDALNGAKLAVKQLNLAGGITDLKGNRHTIDLTAADPASDPNQAIALVRQAAADPSVVAVGGLQPSSIFVPVVPVCGSLKIPTVATGPIAPANQWNVWAYRVNTVIATASPVFYKKLVPKLNLKKIAVIFDQTNPGQVADAQVLKSLAPTLGVSVDPYIAFTSPQVDYSAAVSQIKAAGPDALVVAAQPADGINIVNQLHSAGSSPILLTNSGAFTTLAYWDGTKGSVEGSYTWIQADISTAAGKLKQIIDAYAADNPGKGFSLSVLNGYDGVLALVGAISHADNGADRSAIQKALSNLQYLSNSGTMITFKNPPTGENLTASVLVVQTTGRGQYQAVA